MNEAVKLPLAEQLSEVAPPVPDTIVLKLDDVGNVLDLEHELTKVHNLAKEFNELSGKAHLTQIRIGFSYGDIGIIQEDHEYEIMADGFSLRMWNFGKNHNSVYGGDHSKATLYIHGGQNGQAVDYTDPRINIAKEIAKLAFGWFINSGFFQDVIEDADADTLDYMEYDIVIDAENMLVSMYSHDYLRYEVPDTIVLNLNDPNVDLCATRLAISMGIFGYVKNADGEKAVDRDEMLRIANQYKDDHLANQLKCNQLLLDHGIIKVDYSYAGAGDSADFEDLSCTYKDPDNHVDIDTTNVKYKESDYWFKLEEVDRPLETMIRITLGQLVYSYFPGYENNEGGEGEIEWDPTTKEIVINHRTNYEERYTSYRLDFQEEPVEAVNIWS